MEKKQEFEVYITKYALTNGIQKRMVTKSCSDGMVVDAENTIQSYHGEGTEWHQTFESAKEKANNMRMKKITSLKKQLAKIEKIVF